MTNYERSPSDLPPELLERIFQLHAKSCREPNVDAESSDCSLTTNPYAWIMVTHVCRYWRDVALGSALLWSHIVLTRNLDCIRAFLARSQQAPLTVVQPRSACSGAMTPVAPVRLVLTEMGRIRALELYMKWWIFDDIAALLSKPAAALKSLTLSTPSGLYDYSREPPPMRVRVSLVECSTIQGAEVAAHYERHPGKAVLEDIFGPSPKHLTSLPIVDDIAVLPHMETIKLSGDVVSCSSLLSSLVFPGTTHVFLDFARKARSADLPLATLPIYKKLTGMLPGTVSDISAAPGPPIRVHLTRERSSFLITCYSPSFPGDLNKPEPSLSPSLSISLPQESGCLEAICRDLPTESMKILAISDHFEWRDIAAYLGSPEKLELIGWSMDEVTHLLRHGCDEATHGTDDAAETCAVAFPSLRFLTIGQTNTSYIPKSKQMNDTTKVLEAVNARNRCSSGMRLEKVTFEL